MRQEAVHLTAKQQTVLYKKRDNPQWTNTRIAEAVGCSDSHVSETLSRFEPEELRDDGTVLIDVAEPADRKLGPIRRVEWVGLSAVVQVCGLFVGFNPRASASVAGIALLAFSLAWLLCPVVVFLDAINLHRFDTDFKPNRLVWPITSFLVPVAGVVYYLFKRTV